MLQRFLMRAVVYVVLSMLVTLLLRWHAFHVNPREVLDSAFVSSFWSAFFFLGMQYLWQCRKQRNQGTV